MVRSFYQDLLITLDQVSPRKSAPVAYTVAYTRQDVWLHPRASSGYA
jgi:hypothetical protein